MKYAAVIEFSSDLSRLAEVRPAHRERLGKLRDAGIVAISGPFTDGPGALIVMEVPSKDEAEKILKEDPMTEAGVWKGWTIREWNPVFVNKSVIPDSSL